MSAYEWSKRHRAWIKVCSNKTCPTGTFVGTDDEVESLNMFLEHFRNDHINRNYSDGLHACCHDCARHSYWKSVGIIGTTPNTAKVLFKKQNGRCAICSTKMVMKGPKALQYNLDHDPNTGKYRQLLCNSCNFGLGHFRNSPKLLLAAMVYLQRHSR
jgi:hypothetical protein